MPAQTRRSHGTGPSASHQSTLSFKNKVTKPSAGSAGGKSDLVGRKAQKLNEPATQEIIKAIEIKDEANNVPPPTMEIEAEDDSKAQVQQHRESKGRVELSVVEDEEEEPKVNVRSPSSNKHRSRRPKAGGFEAVEERASKISETQIRRYWKTEEDGRLAPRVHQAALPLHEKILRHFDLSSQFGPCIGIERLSRWKRAWSLNQNPPLEVLAVLLSEERKEQDPKSGGGARQCGKLAYIDELAGGRVVLVE